MTSLLYRMVGQTPPTQPEQQQAEASYPAPFEGGPQEGKPCSPSEQKKRLNAAKKGGKKGGKKCCGK